MNFQNRIPQINKANLSIILFVLSTIVEVFGDNVYAQTTRELDGYFIEYQNRIAVYEEYTLEAFNNFQDALLSSSNSRHDAKAFLLLVERYVKHIDDLLESLKQLRGTALPYEKAILYRCQVLKLFSKVDYALSFENSKEDFCALHKEIIKEIEKHKILQNVYNRQIRRPIHFRGYSCKNLVELENRLSTKYGIDLRNCQQESKDD